MLNERLISVESTSKPKFNVDSTLIQHPVPAGYVKKNNNYFKYIFSDGSWWKKRIAANSENECFHLNRESCTKVNKYLQFGFKHVFALGQRICYSNYDDSIILYCHCPLNINIFIKIGKYPLMSFMILHYKKTMFYIWQFVNEGC
jgi:hypothetical protein